MICPNCNSDNTKVMNSRERCGYRYRQYRCLDCNERFPTAEVVFDAQKNKGKQSRDLSPLLFWSDPNSDLISRKAFELYVQDEWERGEISNGDWITFREWLRDQPNIR